MGYQQISFDPNAAERYGAPLRPYNWVQWAGVVISVLSATLALASIAGDLGWTRKVFASPAVFIGLMSLGSVLMNSRRETLPPADELQRDRNRRTLAITIAICAAFLGAAAVLAFTGA